jgi:gluconate 2-dehydrogenase gamma chain
MAKHDKNRRDFLVRAAASASAVAGAALVPEVFAETQEQQKDTAPSPPAQLHPDTRANPDMQGAFFNHDDAATMSAFTERLMPGAPEKPGAVDAGVLNYIDLALAGAYADQQDFYRRGLAQLGAYCHKIYGKPFVQLSAGQRDEVLTALDEGKAAGFTWPTAQAFFNTVRTHTMEGMFADPLYGGNRDFAGWKLVGFPGAQMFYSPNDMASKEAFSRSPIIGLQTGLVGIAKAPARKG